MDDEHLEKAGYWNEDEDMPSHSYNPIVAHVPIHETKYPPRERCSCHWPNCPEWWYRDKKSGGKRLYCVEHQVEAMESGRNKKKW